MIYAYLRVSTTAQDELNQRLGVDNKAAKLGFVITDVQEIPVIEKIVYFKKK